MPLTYEIDSKRRLIIARGHGVLSHDDVVLYQTTVWSQPEVRGFDEIVDVSGVERIEHPPSQQVRETAGLSAAMDSGQKSRFAIVASEFGAYGLARMYQTYRGLQPKSMKEVAVFRSFEEAWQWIASERRSAPQSQSGAEKPVR